MRIPKFKVGDVVEIVNYGSRLFSKKGWSDMDPELIGQMGRIVKVQFTSDGVPVYMLEGPNKVAWYFEDQLERSYVWT